MSLQGHSQLSLNGHDSWVGEPPGNCKRANLSPILKRSSKEDWGSYRSLSLVPVPEKLTWKIMLESAFQLHEGQEDDWE